MFSSGLSSVISKVFVAEFRHVFVCWEIVVAAILKYFTQQTNNYSKSATEALKQDVTMFLPVIWNGGG